MITADEFERQYAKRSGITVERLRELGRIVATCHCGDDMCEGWQSTTAERLADDLAMREVIWNPDHPNGKRAERKF